MEKAAAFLNDMEIPFEIHALSAHRTPAEVESFAKNAKGRGIKVIIAAAEWPRIYVCDRVDDYFAGHRSAD